MKKVEETSKGANYTAINVGKLDELRNYELPLGPDFIMRGKVFTGKLSGATGSEMSFQSFAPGEGSGSLHTHKHHEELYIIVKGSGEYQVDGKIFPISEGSIIRVAPEGKRALHNTGTIPMVMICIQYLANSFSKDDSPFVDGVMLDGAPQWDK
jgi:mannose-6-phosphate isomerase-like protein (cupin superfamily)